jgi:hypothetical protein
MTEINVDFPGETLQLIQDKLTGFPNNLVAMNEDVKKEYLRSLVDNAIRVYLQLKLIARDKASVNVEAGGKRYIISLG